jgi:hypothetical protein
MHVRGLQDQRSGRQRCEADHGVHDDGVQVDRSIGHDGVSLYEFIPRYITSYLIETEY